MLRGYPVLAVVLLLIGCSPTYAPPVRAAHHGAPGRLQAGRMEVGGTVGGVTVPMVGSPHLAVAVSDLVSLEGGANLNLVANEGSWGLGFVGTRLSWVPRRQAPHHFAGDVELGLGIGAGGELCGNEEPEHSDCPDGDGRRWNDRWAFGLYQGVGVAGHFRWFALFLRIRFEESTARNIPLTWWPSALLGLEFDIVERAAITLGGGYMGFINEIDQAHGVFYQLTVTFMFDVFHRRADFPTKHEK